MSSEEADVVIRFVGESGEGTVSLGDLTTQMLASMGLDIYTFQTFPAEVKGGTVMYQLRAKSGAILSQGDYVDVLVALNPNGVSLYGDGLRENAVLLYDSDCYTPEPDPARKDYALPISSIAKSVKDEARETVGASDLARLPLPKNIVALGALLSLLQAPLATAEENVRSLFGRKGEGIVNMNLAAIRTGAEHIARQVTQKSALKVSRVERDTPMMTVNGNQMISLGAIAGGLKFFAGYPITPATEIMEQLAKDLPKFGGDLIQAEDEIAALGMVIGASYAGKKSMTSSSGPGMSLMVEEINLAATAEIPVVIVDVQRGAPSTGMPTKTSQGDLNLAIYGVHNESPRIVLAASSVEDCFYSTVEAFNLAEAYQCPVILLSDQAMATRKCTVVPPDATKIKLVERLRPASHEGYQRYADTTSGVSAMSEPGIPDCAYISTGLEHDEEGRPGYLPELATQMHEKRFRKFKTLLEERGHEFVRTFGDTGEDIDVGIIGFGSTEGVIREAMERARAQGIRVSHLHVMLINPLPVEQVAAFAGRCRSILVPELNYSGQFAAWLKLNADIKCDGLHKDEGIPFMPNEIYRRIAALAGHCPA